MSTVLVAGSTGYIGRYAVEEYSAAGHEVRALTRVAGRLDRTGFAGSPPVGHLCTEVIGEATKPETLIGVCDGVDVVFSSLGISRQRDGLTFEQVDHLANKALLDEAVRAGVGTFVYVSLWGPEEIGHLEIVAAHERFVTDLQASGIDHTVVRPAGYFSDMGSVLSMAKRGVVLIVGDGTNRNNPIHGRDVARVAVEATGSGEKMVGAGGPEVFSQLELAALAGKVLDKKVRTIRLPQRGLLTLTKGIRRLSDQFGDLAEFLVTAGTVDAVAPSVGTMRLEDYFRELAAR